MHHFNHVKLESLNFNLESETHSDGPRLYTLPDGTKVPSVTTILSSHNKKAIDEWRSRVGENEAKRISGLATRRGTSLHNICEMFLLNELSEVKYRTMMPLTKQIFLQLKNILVDNISKVYCVEQALYSEKLRIAGRVDCIAEWNGKLTVIDFKTSNQNKEKDWIQNYFMQGAAYAEMFEELTDMPIENIVIAIGMQDEMNAQIFHETKHKYVDELKSYIEQYHINHADFKS